MRFFGCLFAACAAIGTAQAGIILSSSDVTGGAGFGNIPRILTIQATGRDSSESGCNSWNGTVMVVGPSACSNGANQGGDEPNPHSSPKDTTPTLASLGFGAASNIGIIFDLSEPGGGENSVTLNSLILKFYSPSGTLLHSESLQGAPISFSGPASGNGNSDFLFVLDKKGLDAVTSAIFSTPNFGNIRIALDATICGAQGGPESFFAQQQTSSAVPEPASLGLIGGGLIGLSFLRRRIR